MLDSRHPVRIRSLQQYQNHDHRNDLHVVYDNNCDNNQTKTQRGNLYSFLKGYWWLITAPTIYVTNDKVHGQTRHPPAIVNWTILLYLERDQTRTHTQEQDQTKTSTSVAPSSHSELTPPSVLGVRSNKDPHTRAGSNGELHERSKQEGLHQRRSNRTSGWLGIWRPLDLVSLWSRTLIHHTHKPYCSIERFFLRRRTIDSPQRDSSTRHQTIPQDNSR